MVKGIVRKSGISAQDAFLMFFSQSGRVQHIEQGEETIEESWNIGADMNHWN